MKTKILILLLISYQFSFGQSNYINYYNKCNEAEYRLITNNITIAKQTYADAFKLVKKPFGKDLYMMAKCFAMENKFDSAYLFLKKAAISVFPFFEGNIKYDPTWNSLFNHHPEYKIKVIEIDSMKINKEDNDKDFIRKTDTIRYFVKEDQLYRVAYTKVQDMGYDSTTNIYKDALSKMIIQDDRIQKELIEYVKQNGYPGLIQTGSDELSIVLVHFSRNNVQLIKPLLLKGIDEGNIYPMEIATMIDRIEYSFEKKCGFSFYSMNYCKESDWPEIIKMRLELGLGIYLGGYGRSVNEKREIFPWVGKLIQ